jgi:hypothetical protein
VVANGKIDWSALGPADGLLLLHPEVVPDGDDVAAFLRVGGRVAVLDDHGVGDRVLQRYQIRRVGAPSAPLYALRNNPQLALAEPVSETLAGRKGGVHPVVAEVSRLVTNHPTGLLHPDLSMVLKIRASGEPDVALAVAGQVGKGRLFAMGDPSAVINQMLRYPGNRAFAQGLVRYLVDDDAWGARQGKLYVVHGRFAEVGAFGGPSALRDARERLRGLRAELAKASASGLPREVTYALAVAAAAALVAWAMRVAARPYQHPQPRFSRARSLLAQGGMAGRAAVLSAESTHRGLVLLEQKDALEEEISLLLGMEKSAGAAAIVDALRRGSYVDEALLGRLERVMTDMATVEAAVGAGAPVRVSAEHLQQADEVAERVREAIVARAASRGAGGGA